MRTLLVSITCLAVILATTVGCGSSKTPPQRLADDTSAPASEEPKSQPKTTPKKDTKTTTAPAQPDTKITRAIETLAAFSDRDAVMNAQKNIQTSGLLVV